MLGNNLKALRKQKGNTQKEIADYLKITREAYTQYETGARKPDYAMLQKLADYYSVSVDTLLGREDSKRTEIVLTDKDIKEIKQKAEAIRDSMMTIAGLAFDGDPHDEDTLEKVMQALEEGFILAKKEAKRKFTPKKYRKDSST